MIHLSALLFLHDDEWCCWCTEHDVAGFGESPAGALMSLAEELVVERFEGPVAPKWVVDRFDSLNDQAFEYRVTATCRISRIRSSTQLTVDALEELCRVQEVVWLLAGQR